MKALINIKKKLEFKKQTANAKLYHIAETKANTADALVLKNCIHSLGEKRKFRKNFTNKQKSGHR